MSCPTAAIQYEEVESIGRWFDDWSERVDSNYAAAIAPTEGNA
jgi:hypothetical protein